MGFESVLWSFPDPTPSLSPTHFLFLNDTLLYVSPVFCYCPVTIKAKATNDRGLLKKQTQIPLICLYET